MTSSRGRLFSASGVLAAGVIAVCVNVLVHRFYKRWDWTGGSLYTLSEPTLETLHSLPDPVEAIVFLSADDSDERLLEAIEAGASSYQLKSASGENP